MCAFFSLVEEMTISMCHISLYIMNDTLLADGSNLRNYLMLAQVGISLSVVLEYQTVLHLIMIIMFFANSFLIRIS